jgi:hypothetical protein
VRSPSVTPTAARATLIAASLGQTRPICDVRAVSASPPTPDALLETGQQSTSFYLRTAGLGKLRRGVGTWSFRRSGTLLRTIGPVVRGGLGDALPATEQGRLPA